MREALQEEGVPGELIVISDGDSAIRYIDALDSQPDARPNLVILDLNLPKCNGLEVLKVLRASSKCKGTPVVILSSSDLQKDREESFRLGATHYIRKPLRLEEFLSLGSVFRAVLENPLTE